MVVITGELKHEDRLIAGIELGGTKINCILARGPKDIVAEERIPTTDPDETLGRIEAVLDQWQGFEAIGVASFGPIIINRSSATYGSIGVTPKPGWTGTDIVNRLQSRYDKPIGFHTDVVGAALAEAAWGAASGLPDVAYITVGTGVGVGLVAHGMPVDGLTHAELGHIRPVRYASDDWVGSCKFHGACVEGLVSGPAIAARTGTPAENLSKDDPAWDQVVHTIAQLLNVLVLTGVPRRIVFGGGVMVGNDFLLPRIRSALSDSLGGYLPLPEIEDINTFVVPAALGNRAGPLGAILLGLQALRIATAS
ncbi:ROK family protein [Sphingomonas beigongshangi]|jgi:fructokinase|uniref:ROK family protein n=1 Tax=Sphingomonas beigongshangi TaxID=2782540 RepID=UPI001AEDA732|nr:ROK family protein [Sphingomonas beigongshangi]